MCGAWWRGSPPGFPTKLEEPALLGSDRGRQGIRDYVVYVPRPVSAWAQRGYFWLRETRATLRRDYLVESAMVQVKVSVTSDYLDWPKINYGGHPDGDF